MTEASSSPSPSPAGLRALWRSFPIFCDLDDQALAALPALASSRTWSAGEVIFDKGDPGDFMLALTAGRIKLSILSESGRELLIRIAEPGDLVGEIACLDGLERTTAATAMSDVSGFILRRNDFRSIAARFPALHEAAIAHLAGMLRGTNDRLESVSLYQLHARIARFILLTLHQLNGETLDPISFLTLNVNQTDLGLLVGATRPKVNRVLQDFRDAGALVQEGATWRCDVAALRNFAAE